MINNSLVLLCLLLSGNQVFAASTAQKNAGVVYEQFSPEMSSNGLFVSFPAYLYGTSSVCGVHGGYQFNKWQLRFDMSFANEVTIHDDTWFALPSVGFFYNKDFTSFLRFYDGIAIGSEHGIQNSFNGIVGFIKAQAGAELLMFGSKTFFVEAGTAFTFKPKEGAFNGGSVIGGGFKYYFNGKKQTVSAFRKDAS